MIPPFDEALADLLNQYSRYDLDEIIAALELALMAKKEEAAAEEDDE